MTYMISITIADEFVRDCIEREKQNKSALITDLLHQYYKSNLCSYMKPEQITERKMQLEKQENVINKEKSQLSKAEEDFLKRSQEQEDQLQNSSKREEELKKNRLKSYEDMINYFFDVGEQQAKELAFEFEKSKDKYENLYEWGLLKALRVKEQNPD